MPRIPKPRLASGKQISVDAAPGAADLAENAPVIRVGDTREALPVRAGRNLLALALLAVGLVVAIYAVLAATVLVGLPAGGHAALVLRGAYSIGQVPSGALIYVSSAPVDYSLTGKVTQAVAGVPAGSVVQVVAGPNARIGTGPDRHIWADGHPTAFPGTVTARTLGRTYVALCVTGACRPGAPVLVPQDNIVGGVQGYLTPTGLTHPDTLAAHGPVAPR